jgi:hypothetical protein
VLNIIHMVKKRLHGRMLMLVLFAHSIIESTSVAIERWAEVAALGEGAAKRVGERYSLSLFDMQVSYSPQFLSKLRYVAAFSSSNPKGRRVSQLSESGLLGGRNGALPLSH